MDWKSTKDDTPPQDKLLDVITETGRQTQLILSRGLFWLPDRSMYVYYVPMLWRVAQ